MSQNGATHMEEAATHHSDRLGSEVCASDDGAQDIAAQIIPSNNIEGLHRGAINVMAQPTRANQSGRVRAKWLSPIRTHSRLLRVEKQWPRQISPFARSSESLSLSYRVSTGRESEG